MSLISERVLTAFSVIVCLALNGCSSSEGNSTLEPSAPHDSGVLTVDGLLLEMTGVHLIDAQGELGMSDSTYAIYREVADRGYVLASDIVNVMPELISCVEDVGFEVVYDPSNEGFFGLPDIGWSYVTPSGTSISPAEEQLILECSIRTDAALTALFFNQPYSPERNDVWITDDRKEASWTCLDEAGYFVRDDASFQDYLDLAKRMADETGDSACLELVLYGEGE